MVTRNYLRNWICLLNQYNSYRNDYIFNAFADDFIYRRKATGSLETNTFMGYCGVESCGFFVIPNRRGGNEHTADAGYFQKAWGGILTFGEGNRKPGVDDYELAAPISINQLVQVYGTKGHTKIHSTGLYKDRAYFDGEMTALNVSGRTLHIREVGFWGMSNWGLTEVSNTWLAARYLIPETVVAPGDCFVFKYRVMY